MHENRFQTPEDQESGIREYDQRRGPTLEPRGIEEFGAKVDYGWSDDKARQYSQPQREDFGTFVRSRGFSLE